MSSKCRSLLAGDAVHVRNHPVLNRLPHDKLWALSLSNGQAGSYK